MSKVDGTLVNPENQLALAWCECLNCLEGLGTCLFKAPAPYRKTCGKTVTYIEVAFGFLSYIYVLSFFLSFLRLVIEAIFGREY